MRFELLLLLIIPLMLIIPLDAQADHCPPDEQHVNWFGDAVCFPLLPNFEITPEKSIFSNGQHIHLNMTTSYISDDVYTLQSQYTLDAINSENNRKFSFDFNRVGTSNVWTATIGTSYFHNAYIGTYDFNYPVNIFSYSVSSPPIIIADIPFSLDPKFVVTTNATNYNSGNVINIEGHTEYSGTPFVYIFNEDNQKKRKDLVKINGFKWGINIDLDTLKTEFPNGLIGKIKIIMDDGSHVTELTTPTYSVDTPVSITLNTYSDSVIYGGVITFSGEVSHRVLDNNYVTFKFYKQNDPIPINGTDVYINTNRSFTYSYSPTDGSFPKGTINGVVEYQNSTTPITFELNDRPLFLDEKAEVAYTASQSNILKIESSEDDIKKHDTEMTQFRPWVNLVESVNLRLTSAETTITTILTTLSGLSSQVADNMSEMNGNQVLILNHTADIQRQQIEIDFLYQILNMTEPIP